MATTQTEAVVSLLGSLALTGSSARTHLPQKLPFSLDSYPKLDDAQAGHLRHFHNLGTQRDGDWAHMGAQEPAQEWLDAYRYQLATMAYAAAAAHYHRLPAVRAPFRAVIEQLVQKMLRPDVWSYWYLTSQSGVSINPDIKELRVPWADPVKKENIMYSGHLLLMTSLHAMLFDSDKYDAPGALTFVFDPLFWGMGRQEFKYTRSSLQDVILKNIEDHGWLGCPCEPNSIFIVCNQFPLIAMRYNDVRNGTTVAQDAIQKYRAAWQKKNNMQVGEDGLLVDMYWVQQDRMLSSGSVGMSAWAGAMMNSWDPARVHSLYPRQARGFFTRLGDGRVLLNLPPLAKVARQLAQESREEPDSEALRAKAIEQMKSLPPRKSPGLYVQPTFGYVAEWVSEMGDAPRLAGLLAHADATFSPTWEKGGLYYPARNAPHENAMDPFTGNAAIGYARLNVPDGQRKMFDKPWDAKRVREYPAVHGVQLGDGVDFLRGEWDGERKAFILSLRSWSGEPIEFKPSVSSLPSGIYGVYIDGELQRQVECHGGDVNLEVTVGGKGVDVVLLHSQP